MRELLVRPAAETDLADAFEWHERKESGLGYRLLATVHDRIDAICENPHGYERLERGYQRAQAPPFQYVVLFRATPDRVEVVGVLHTSRDDRV